MRKNIEPKGELYYVTECGFMFPVPISDTGDGTFLDEDKAMFFMRYIRKQIEAIKRDNVENELTEQYGGTIGMITE